MVNHAENIELRWANQDDKKKKSYGELEIVFEIFVPILRHVLFSFLLVSFSVAEIVVVISIFGYF